MRSVFFLLAVLPLALQSHARLIYDVNAGYSSQTVRSKPFHLEGNGYTHDLSLKGAGGLYVGVGLSFIKKKQPIGPFLRIGLAFQKLGFRSTAEYHEVGTSMKVQGGVYGISFLQFDPGIYVSPVFGNIRVLAGLGLPVEISMNEGYRSSLGFGLRAGIGYKGLLFTGGYQAGLTESIKATIGDVRIEDAVLKGKSNILTLGLALSLRWFSR